MLYYWPIPFNKHACYTVHVFPCNNTVVYMYTQINAHKSKTKQQTATLIYLAIAIYVPTTKMPLKCYMYANLFRCRY